MQDIVIEVIRRFDSMKSVRSIWESHWQELKELVRPVTSNFNRTGTQGSKDTDKIYDGTAPWSLEQLASGLNSYLTSPTDRWFTLTLEGVEHAAIPRPLLMWLEYVSDIIYAEYGNTASKFNPQIHELYLDIGAFGTAVIYSEYSWTKRHMLFRCFPLADCFISEDSDGMVDTMYRKIKMTLRQCEQQFGELPTKIKSIAEKNPHKEVEVIHAVFPRTDRDIGKLTKTNKAFASVWIVLETKELLLESGFDQFPYHVPRWTKLAGEVYGRSPAMTCLPDIKMLNQMAKVVIKAAQKIVDPPLMVPDDGFLLPIRTTPGSLMFYTPGTDHIEPLKTDGRVDIGLEMMQQRREQIAKAFYVDWLMQQKNNVEMTATEVIDRRQEKLSLMAPMLGRLQSELLGPIIRRTVSSLAIAGRLPPPPEALQRSGKKLTVMYVSPAARAQFATKAINIQRFTQDLIPFAQVSPNIMDAIDTDQLAQELSSMRDVTPKIMRTPEMIKQIREARGKEQQALQRAAVGKDTASAVKDLATAGRMNRESV